MRVCVCECVCVVGVCVNCCQGCFSVYVLRPCLVAHVSLVFASFAGIQLGFVLLN